MLIAEKLRRTNRAEYLLYLWQLEDLLRAYDCNPERLDEAYLSHFQVSPEERAKMRQWYADLCHMMLSEGVREKGHLRMSLNVMQTLAELHDKLLASGKFPYYREMYYKVLPLIVELRSKESHQPQPDEQRPGGLAELTTCFNALYGVMLLRLQHKPLSQGTAEAVKTISTWLGQLSDYYLQGVEQQLDND